MNCITKQTCIVFWFSPLQKSFYLPIFLAIQQQQDHALQITKNGSLFHLILFLKSWKLELWSVKVSKKIKYYKLYRIRKKSYLYIYIFYKMYVGMGNSWFRKTSSKTEWHNGVTKLSYNLPSYVLCKFNQIKYL